MWEEEKRYFLISTNIWTGTPSVGAVTTLRPVVPSNRRSILGRAKRCLCSPKYPYRFLGLPNFLVIGYWDSFLWGQAAILWNWQHTYSTEVENQWSFAFMSCTVNIFTFWWVINKNFKKEIWPGCSDIFFMKGFITCIIYYNILFLLFCLIMVN